MSPACQLSFLEGSRWKGTRCISRFLLPHTTIVFNLHSMSPEVSSNHFSYHVRGAIRALFKYLAVVDHVLLRLRQWSKCTFPSSAAKILGVSPLLVAHPTCFLTPNLS
jgi:hypothetical protein